MNKKLIIVFILLLIILGLVFVLHSSYFAITEIVVQGNSRITKAEIIQASGVEIGENILLLPGREVVNRLIENVRIKGVKLERNFPNTLVISVNERRSIGLFPKEGKWFELASDGTILATYVTGDKKPILPVVEGLNWQIKDGRADLTFEVEKFLSFLKGFSLLQKRLTMVSYSTGKIYIVFDTGMEVYFGHVASLEKSLAVFYTIWNSMQNPDKKIKYLDLRYTGKPVIRMR